MKKDITQQSLSAFGYSNYTISIAGDLYKNGTAQQKDKLNRFYIVDDNGNRSRIQQKELYRKAYNKEFSIDKI